MAWSTLRSHRYDHANTRNGRDNRPGTDNQEEFRAAFRKSAMKRAKLRGLQRNATVVLGKWGTPDDVDVLTRALDDDEPLVREHAVWALTQLDGDREAPRQLLTGASQDCEERPP